VLSRQGHNCANAETEKTMGMCNRDDGLRIGSDEIMAVTVSAATLTVIKKK